MKIRINADDFGMSPGVNGAIAKMFQANKLHSASLVCGCDHFDEAVRIAKANPALKVGLHFNLTTGKAISEKSDLLVDKEGRFRNGFLSLLLLSIFQRKSLENQVRAELEAQISLLRKSGISVYHIDSHRHVHVIPTIFSVVTEIAKKHKIKHIRVINERFSNTWFIPYPKTYLFDGGIVKWLILRGLGLFNRYKTSTYFFSILYTCSISDGLVRKVTIPQGFDDVEIMIHPGNPAIDEPLNLLEKRHLVSANRYIENL